MEYHSCFNSYTIYSFHNITIRNGLFFYYKMCTWSAYRIDIGKKKYMYVICIIYILVYHKSLKELLKHVVEYTKSPFEFVF